MRPLSGSARPATAVLAAVLAGLGLLLGLFLAAPGTALAAAPPNDYFVNHKVVGRPYPYVDTIASTAQATTEASQPLNPCGVHWPVTKTVWYRLAVSGEAVVQIDTVGSVSTADWVLVTFVVGFILARRRIRGLTMQIRVLARLAARPGATG